MIKLCLENNGLKQDEVAMYVFHQANMYILEFLRKKIRIEKDKFYCNLREVGNTVSSTIPIALRDAQEAGLLKGNVAIAGFGVGLSWGATILKIK
jgi:3-oxoacyl-[acyl-carrier-protein] synthase-3